MEKKIFYLLIDFTMKKLWLVSVLSLGLILLAGCKPATPVDITNSNDLISVYNQSKAMTCNTSYETETEQGSSVMYIKNGMISQVSTSTIEWETANMYVLARDGKMYVWGSLYGEWAGVSMAYDMDIEQELSTFDDLDDAGNMSCVNGVQSNSVFDIPSNIEFTSMDERLGDGQMEELEEIENIEFVADDENNMIENVEENVDSNVEIEENVEQVNVLGDETWLE